MQCCKYILIKGITMPVNITGVHFNSFGISCYQKKNLWGGH
ncbi:hypothetical protein EAKF1_ch4206 [Escherichia albertii KF1]|nr:hypothetical protein EAKF1_ch4206 [Escherichia albertii KF1]